MDITNRRPKTAKPTTKLLRIGLVEYISCLNPLLSKTNNNKVYLARLRTSLTQFKVIKNALRNAEQTLHENEVLMRLHRLTTYSHLLVPEVINTHSMSNNIYQMSAYCEGGSLDQIIRELKAAGKWFSWDDAIAIFAGILTGYCFLMQENITHNDLDARNIFFKDRQPLIADFGNSRAEADSKKWYAAYAVGDALSLQKLAKELLGPFLQFTNKAQIPTELMCLERDYFSKKSFELTRKDQQLFNPRTLLEGLSFVKTTLKQEYRLPNLKELIDEISFILRTVEPTSESNITVEEGTEEPNESVDDKVEYMLLNYLLYDRDFDHYSVQYYLRSLKKSKDITEEREKQLYKFYKKHMIARDCLAIRLAEAKANSGNPKKYQFKKMVEDAKLYLKQDVFDIKDFNISRYQGKENSRVQKYSHQLVTNLPLVSDKNYNCFKYLMNTRDLSDLRKKIRSLLCREKTSPFSDFETFKRIQNGLHDSNEWKLADAMQASKMAEQNPPHFTPAS